MGEGLGEGRGCWKDAPGSTRRLSILCPQAAALSTHLLLDGPGSPTAADTGLKEHRTAHVGSRAGPSNTRLHRVALKEAKMHLMRASPQAHVFRHRSVLKITWKLAT